MKKVFTILLACCMGLSLAACGGSSPSGSSKVTDGEYTAEHPLVIKVAHDDVLESPLHRSFVSMKEHLDSESKGRIKVEIYANSELGDTAELADMIGMGTLQMANMMSDIPSSYNDKLSFLCLPFLFEDYEQAQKLVFEPDSALYNLYQEEANKVGYYLLGFQYDGSRGVSNNVREIKTAADLKGLKLRVMQTDISIATYTALGCNVTPLAFSEVYTALQQKVVDGQDNPPILTINAKLNEVQKYYSTVDSRLSITVLLTSQEWLMSLPEDLREMITHAAQEYACKQQREESRAIEGDSLKKIEESGCKVTYVTDKSSFIEATQPVYDQYRKVYGDEFMDKVMAAVGK